MPFGQGGGRVSLSPNGSDFPDWIELYNGGAEATSVGGLVLAFRQSPTVSRWTMPDDDLALLQPGGCVLVTAGGGSDAWDASFDLNTEFGGVLLETADAGCIIDQLYYGDEEGGTATDSYRRAPRDGGDRWELGTGQTPCGVVEATRETGGTGP
jgi:hypothetical protein